MKVFVDANVILDVLDQREQFFEASSNFPTNGLPVLTPKEFLERYF